MAVTHHSPHHAWAHHSGTHHARPHHAARHLRLGLHLLAGGWRRAARVMRIGRRLGGRSCGAGRHKPGHHTCARAISESRQHQILLDITFDCIKRVGTWAKSTHGSKLGSPALRLHLLRASRPFLNWLIVRSRLCGRCRRAASMPPVGFFSATRPHVLWHMCAPADRRVADGHEPRAKAVPIASSLIAFQDGAVKDGRSAWPRTSDDQSPPSPRTSRRVIDADHNTAFVEPGLACIRPICSFETDNLNMGRTR